ncbi:porin, partial [Sutterella sp.]|uniref:porin n=1 Tax=Sutterella sp. TaxID=1981025 RepID=UPI0026DF3D08
DLGNGFAVGFILENGFKADDGTLADSSRIFNREASVSLYSPYGQFSFGRIGSINQGTSSWGKAGLLSAFGTSYTTYVAQVGNFAKADTVRDNMIAYMSPTFAGINVYAQYSMGDSNGTENKPTSNRYYALGASYINGPVLLYGAVDSINYKADTTRPNQDDSLTVTLGGSYDFGVAKVFLVGQYLDEAALSSISSTVNKLALDGSAFRFKGWGASLSASIPAFGGKFLAGVAYDDAETADSETIDADLTRYIVSLGYEYNLSKRTNVYAVASYMQDEIEPAGGSSIEPSATAVKFGLRHKF